VRSAPGNEGVETEAAALAVVCRTILAIAYRETHFSHVPRIVRNTLVSTGVVMLILAAGQLSAWVITVERLPEIFVQFVYSITRNKAAIIAARRDNAAYGLFPASHFRTAHTDAHHDSDRKGPRHQSGASRRIGGTRADHRCGYSSGRSVAVHSVRDSQGADGAVVRLLGTTFSR
jgi:Ca2+/Na+ antiporter